MDSTGPQVAIPLMVTAATTIKRSPAFSTPPMLETIETLGVKPLGSTFAV
jgi:hypothetical protein